MRCPKKNGFHFLLEVNTEHFLKIFLFRNTRSQKPLHISYTFFARYVVSFIQVIVLYNFFTGGCSPNSTSLSQFKPTQNFLHQNYRSLQRQSDRLQFRLELALIFIELSRCKPTLTTSRRITHREFNMYVILLTSVWI